MRLEKRYLRGKSKRRGQWRCCGVALPVWSGKSRGGAILVLAAVVLAATCAWASLTFLLGGTPPALGRLLPGRAQVDIGDYPELLLARYEHRKDPEPSDLWSSPQEHPWKACVAPSPSYPASPPHSNGYLQVFLDGGLNQQRIGICNAVAVAKILNATLLIPEFQINAVWLDSSKFSDIFDEDHFIRALRRDVRVVRQLPKKLQWSTREYYAAGEHKNRIKLTPMHAPASWYLANVLPKMQKFHVVAIAPFTHRLAFSGLPADIQRLRCRVNYYALRFVPSIEGLGRKLVDRLRDPRRRHVARGILYDQGKSAADMVEYGKSLGHSSGLPQGNETASAVPLGAGGEWTGPPGTGQQTQRRLLMQVLGAGAVAGKEEEEEEEAGSEAEGGLGGREVAALEGGIASRQGLHNAPLGLWERLAGKGRKKKYVALHLRFDKDMVAHSACDYGESMAEKEALAKYREYAWMGRVEKLRFSSAQLRREGKCPLTPEEAGLFLAALGFRPPTPLYIATYQVYGGPKRLAPLRQLFPHLEDKTSLATPEELQPLLGKASHLAALDFYVAFHSDAFVSASAGNMHNIMIGHRSFFGGSKTINVNMTLMAELLLNVQALRRKHPSSSSSGTGAGRHGSEQWSRPARDLMWSHFCKRVRQGHKARMGKIKLRRSDQSIYTYPAPDCLCPADAADSATDTNTNTL